MILGFDGFVFNLLGQIYADNIVIQSNYMSLLSHISAKKSLYLTGIFSLQLLSLTTANRNSNNTLISLNAGLSLPNFKDIKSILNPMSIVSLVQCSLATFVAPAVPAVGIGLGVAGAAMSCYAMYRAIKGFVLNMQRREKGKLRPYELYPLIGVAAQFAKAGFIFSSFVDPAVWEAAAQPITEDAFASMASGFDYGTLVQSVGGLLGSSEVNSLISLDAGISFNLVSGQTALLAANFGLNASGFGQYTRTLFLANGGANFSPTQSFKVVYMENMGQIQSALHASILANQFINFGVINLSHGSINVADVTQAGRLVLNGGSLQGNNYHSLHGSETELISVRGRERTIDIAGRDKFTDTSLVGNSLDIEAGAETRLERAEIAVIEVKNQGQIDADSVYFTGDKLNNERIINLSGHSEIEVTNVCMKAGSVLHGATSDSRPDAEECSEVEAKNTLYIQAASLIKLDGEVNGFDASFFGGKNIELGSSSHSTLENCGFKADEDIDLAKAAQGNFKDLDMEAQSIHDASDTHIAGEVSYRAGVSYTHTGRMDSVAEGSSIYVKAPTASFDGSVTVDRLSIDVGDNAISEDMLYARGEGVNYQATKQFDVKIDENFVMNEQSNRTCGLGIEAYSIDVAADINANGSVMLKSTQGDVTVTAEINADKFSVDSTGDFNTNSHVHAQEDASIWASHDVNNYAGSIEAEHDLLVSGETIRNYGVHADGVPQDALPMGDSGDMYAGHDNYQDARNGDLDNEAAVIAAGHYLQGTASGNIINHSGSHLEKRPYDTVTVPDAATFCGGTGRDGDQVGLYLHAAGQVLVTASNILSQGGNDILGDNGVFVKAIVLNYISYQTRKSSWLGMHHKWITVFSQQVYGSSIESLNGSNNLVSHGGEVETEAAQFISKNGNNFYAHGKVGLYDVITHLRATVSKETFGIKSGSDVSDALANPTLVYDAGDSTICSQTDNAYVSGAVIAGLGNIHFITPNGKTIFGRSVLDHSVLKTSYSVQISIPVINAFESLTKTQDFWSAAQALNPTLSGLSFQNLLNSSSGYEYAANSLNTLVRAYNAIASISGFLSRNLNLSNYAGVHVSLSRTHTSETYQTLATEGVNRGGNMTVVAQQLVMRNAAVVHVDGDADIDAKSVFATGAKLESTYHQDRQSIGASFTPTGQFKSADASYLRTDVSEAQWVNANLSVNGNLHIHQGDDAMDDLSLDAANIDAGTMDADINHLNMTDEQSTSYSSSLAMSASTTGQVSFDESTSSAAIVAQTSGIHSHGGINTDGHRFHVNYASMWGGMIASDAVNKAEIDYLETQQIHDYSKFNSAGMSTNVTDFFQFKHQATTSADLPASDHTTSEPSHSILPTTATVSFGRNRYDATRTSVISGVESTDISIGEQVGELRTDMLAGVQLYRDSHTNLHLDLPLATVQEYKESFDRIKHAAASVIGLFSKNDENLPVPGRNSQNYDFILPVRRNEQDCDDYRDEADDDDDLMLDSDAVELVVNEALGPDLDPYKLGVDPNDFLPDDLVKVEGVSYSGDANTAPWCADFKGISAEAVGANNASLGLGIALQTAGTGLGYLFGKAGEMVARDGVSQWVKAGVSAHGHGLSLILNFAAQASLNPDQSSLEDLLQAGKSEIGEYGIEYGIRMIGLCMGEELAGPVGWLFLGLSILDELTYSHERNDSWLVDADSHFNQSAQELIDGKYVACIEDVALAVGEDALVCLSEGVHQVAQLPEKVAGLAYKAGGWLYRQGAVVKATLSSSRVSI